MKRGFSLPAVTVLAVLLGSGCGSPPVETEAEPQPPEMLIPPELSGIGKELTETAEATAPAVVEVHNQAQVLKPLGRYLVGLAEGLGSILNPHPYWEWPYRVVAFPFYVLFGYLDLSESRGSGFYIGEGLVITNAHVVDNSERLICRHIDGRVAEAEVLQVDIERDLALLKVQKMRGGFPQPLKLRRYLSRPGEPIMAVGYPVREMMDSPFQSSVPVDEETLVPVPRVTVGVVSARDVELGNPATRYLETDAALNPGNSGGPVIGLDGTVLGVATMVGVGKENEGYAVPSRTVLTVFKDVLEKEPAQAPPKKEPKQKKSAEGKKKPEAEKKG